MLANIIVDTSYANYDAMQYYRFEYLLHKDYIETLDKMLSNELDCMRITKNGQQIVKTTDFRYEEDIYRYIRILLKIPNQFLYNIYFDKLQNIHNKNKEFEQNLTEIITIQNANINIIKKDKNKKVKTPKADNKWLMRETNNLFTGEQEYEYYNLKTGESFYDKSSDLLDELNAKKPKRTKKEPRKDFGKIILKFDMK